MTLGITNPDASGLGDSGFAAHKRNGPLASYPETSLIDDVVIVQNSTTGDPSTLKTGVVKFFNDTKGFGFVLESDGSDGTSSFYEITGVIHPCSPR